MATYEPPTRILGFTVEIDGISDSHWTAVHLPAASTEPDDDGWGETRRQELEMERIFDPDDTMLHDWKETVADGADGEALKTVVVTVFDQEGADRATWTFEDAWITYYQPPQLDPSTLGEVASERVVLAYDSMDRQEG